MTFILLIVPSKLYRRIIDIRKNVKIILIVIFMNHRVTNVKSLQIHYWFLFKQDHICVREYEKFIPIPNIWYMKYFYIIFEGELSKYFTSNQLQDRQIDLEKRAQRSW